MISAAHELAAIYPVRRRLGVATSAVVLVLCVGAVAGARGGPADAGAPPDRSPAAERRERAAVRDSLRVDLRKYEKIIAALRDSVAHLDRGDRNVELRKLQFQKTIDEVTAAMGENAGELSDLDVQVFDNAIRLSDRDGGSISIQFPEGLEENIARGLGHLSRVILDELPDTMRVELPRSPVGDAGSAEPRGPAARVAPPAPRGREMPPPVVSVSPGAAWTRAFGLDAFRRKKVIEGDVVKVRDNVVVQRHEIVRGNVVAIAGDALIEGQVDGDVVVVLGDLQLADGANVGGRVTTVLGKLDRADDATVGAVAVVNPGSQLDLNLRDLAAGRGTGLTFLAAQGFFVLALLVVMILMAALPAARLEQAATTLAQHPVESLSLGLLAATAGHLLLGMVVVVLSITVIGAPVALLAMLGALVLDLIAVGVACLVIGRWLCARFSLGCGRGWVLSALGMIAVHVPSFLATLLAWQGGVPVLAAALFWAGVGLKVLVYVLGLGALISSRLGTRVTAPLPDELAPLATP